MDKRLPARRTLLLGLPGLLALGACKSSVGTVLPDNELPGLPGLRTTGGWDLPGFAPGEFTRAVSVLNVWASWCPVCRDEHSELKRLARDSRFRLLGLVYMDKPAAAVDYLRRAGNPYAAVARDDGQLSRALGQRGVPGSYVIGRSGRVLANVAGGIDERSFTALLLPAIQRALEGNETTTG